MPNIGFVDVSEESFKEYVKVLHPKYKGNPVNMYQMRKDDLYSRPIITDADTPSIDAQRFFLKSRKEYDHIVTQLAKHDRKPLQVTKNINCIYF